MTGVKGVSSNLHEPRIPLGERIELCSNVFLDKDVFLPNKNQVLCDWMCGVLQQLQQNLRSLEIEGENWRQELSKVRKQQLEIWKLLLQVLQKSDAEPISLRQRFVTVLFGELLTLKDNFEDFEKLGDSTTEEESISGAITVFSCCIELLRNSQITLLLFNKLDNIEQCLKHALSCFLAIWNQPSINGVDSLIKECCSLVNLALQQYSNMQRQQVTQRKVFSNLCEKLLYHLLLVRHTLVSSDTLNCQSCPNIVETVSEMISRIDSVVTAGLFHVDHLTSYKQSLETKTVSSEPSPKKQKVSAYTEELLEVLRSPGENTKENYPRDIRSVLTSLPFLFENFLIVTKDETKIDRMVKFNFFVKLYNIVKEVNVAQEDVNKVLVLNEMLQILLDYDVYQIAEDNVNGQPMFLWFLELMDEMLKSRSQNDLAVFKCLNTLLQLNHKIIESAFKIVLCLCLVKPSQESVEVREEKTRFLHNVIETYSKLQQVEYLVTCMLNVIQSLAENVGPIPVRILTKLSQVFEQSPLSLTITLFRVFVNEMRSVVESMQSALVLEAVTALFVTFLTNSSYNAADQHGINSEKVSSLETLLTDTKAHILMPLIEAFTRGHDANCQAAVGFSALYLLYGLNEVVSYLKCHNVITNDVNDQYWPPQMVWYAEHGTFFPDPSWGTTAELLSTNGHLRYCINMLTAQKARHLMSRNVPDMAEIALCIDFLYGTEHLSSILAKSSPTWDENVVTVSSENYGTAHWHLLVNHAPLFIPYCSKPQVNAFAKHFIQMLVQDDQHCLEDHTLMTTSYISKKILEAGELLNLPAAQDAIVSEYWKLVGKAAEKIAQGRFPTLGNIFSWERPGEASGMQVDDSEVAEIDAGGEIESEGSEMVDGSLGDCVSVEGVGGRGGKRQKSGMVNENLGGEDVAEVDVGNEGMESKGEHETEMREASFLAQDLAKVMKERANQMSESHLQEEHKRKVKKLHIQDMKKLLCTLRDLHCSMFTLVNQTRCLLGLLVCDVVVQACDVVGVMSSLQLSCRQTLVTLLQEQLQRYDFVAWNVVDMESLLPWLRSTMTAQSSYQEASTTENQPSLSEISSTLLQVAILLGVKSRSKTDAKAISSFHEELLASVPDKIKPNAFQNIEQVYSVLLACMKLLSQRLFNKSSVTRLTNMIKASVRCLVDQITKFMKKDRVGSKTMAKCEEFETLIFKLIGVLTKAVGLIAWSDELASKWSVEDRLDDWGDVVGLAFTDTVAKLEFFLNDSESIAYEQVVTWVTILEDISRCAKQHRNHLPEDFQGKIFEIGLRVLSSFQTGSGGDEIEKCGIVGEVVLRLFSTTLEVDNGEHCATLLENLVEISLGKKGHHESPLKVVTCLSVFHALLSTKIAKKRKKDIRSKFGNILIQLLRHATSNIEILTLVLEIIASVLSLGKSALFSKDLALVLQALALARGIEVEKAARKFSRLFTARFVILSLTLFYYHDNVYDVIHVYLACASDLLASLLAGTSREIAPVLPTCAQKMSRLFQELASHKDVFRKYVTYFLSDCVHLMSTLGMQGSIRETLIEGVHCILDVCEDDTLTKVHVFLPSADRELLRTLQEDFNKHHKFKGNA